MSSEAEYCPKVIRYDSPEAGELASLVETKSLGGYAPGNYMCRCMSCGATHEADKRATQCFVCAVKSAASQLAAVAAERDALRTVVSQCAEATGAFISPKASIDFMEKLPGEIRLNRSNAERLLAEARELVEQAFRDGLAYGGNVENADPDLAWQQSRIRVLSNQEVGK